MQITKYRDENKRKNRKDSKNAYRTKHIAAVILVTLLTAFTSVQSVERCNIYTENYCFGIDWTTATQDQIKSIDHKTQDVNGRTSLHWATSRSSDPEVINALLEAGHLPGSGRRGIGPFGAHCQHHPDQPCRSLALGGGFDGSEIQKESIFEKEE